jgi:hypothetical protein
VYIFIDPGETTGWAKFADNGDTIALGQVKGFDNLCAFININLHISQPIKQVTVEEFKLYPWKSNAQMWSEFETVQVIGAIRAKCYTLNLPYETVPAKNYPMGFRYQGMDVPPHSNPLHDQLVAHAHGVYWLQSHGIRKPQAR